MKTTVARRSLAIRIAVVPVAALALSLAACGAQRPSADDVASGFQKIVKSSQVSDDAAKCVGQKLVDSRASNESLNYIAKGEDKQKNEEDKDIVTKVISDSLPDCMKKNPKS